MEGRVPSRAACFVLMPLVEMELDLPEGRRFARAQCLWSGADCGVMEGRVPSRPTCSVLMPLVEMELDLPGRAPLCWGSVFVIGHGFGLLRGEFHLGLRALC